MQSAAAAICVYHSSDASIMQLIKRTIVTTTFDHDCKLKRKLKAANQNALSMKYQAFN